MNRDDLVGEKRIRRAMARCGGVLACLLTLAVSLPAVAQDAKPKPKRPALKVRVVGPDTGVPVVVTEEQGAPAAKADGAAAEPEVENWLVDTPPADETWLAPQAPAPSGQPAAPAPEPAAPGTEVAPPPSNDLLGVQHYMESVGAEDTSGSQPGASVPFSAPTVASTPVRVNTPPSTARYPTSSASGAPSASSAPMRSPAPDDADRYRLGPGDRIDVHVWRNPELTRSVPVRPDGLISLPLAGELMAAGKTVAQLEQEVTAVLGEYVQFPTVTVSVTEVRGMVVYVVGRVASPGTLQLDRPVNVIQAIAMAGGLQEFADRNGVVVIRTVNGHETRMPFRYGDALKGRADGAPIILQSGDVIYVP